MVYPVSPVGWLDQEDFWSSLLVSRRQCQRVGFQETLGSFQSFPSAAPNAIQGMGLVNTAGSAMVTTDTNISVAYSCQNVFLVRGACAHTQWVSCDCVPTVFAWEFTRWIGLYLGKRKLRRLWARFRSFGLEVAYLFSLLFVASSWTKLVSWVYVRNMGLSQGRAVNIVKAKFKLDKVKEARKTLFKDVAIEERPEQSLPQLHWNKGQGRF